MPIARIDAISGSDILENSPQLNTGAVGVIPGVSYFATNPVARSRWFAGAGVSGFMIDEPAAADAAVRHVCMRPGAVPSGLGITATNFASAILPMLPAAGSEYRVTLRGNYLASSEQAVLRINASTGALIAWTKTGSMVALLDYRVRQLVNAFQFSASWSVLAGQLPSCTITRELPTTGGAPTTMADWWYGSPHMSMYLPRALGPVVAPTSEEPPEEP